MKVTVCDICEKVVEKQAEDYTQETEDGTVSITLTEGQDRCLTCDQKMKAKLARKAWDALKNKRG